MNSRTERPRSSRISLEVLSKNLSRIRDLLTEEENLLLELRLQGKTDNSIAILLKMPLSTVNRKRKRLQEKIEAKLWWLDNGERVLNDLSWTYHSNGRFVMEHVALGMTHDEILAIAPPGWTKWQIGCLARSMIYDYAQQDEGFKRFMENMKLGYHLPWQKKTK